MLNNKLRLKMNIEVNRTEERLSKKRAKQLFKENRQDNLAMGTFKGLSDIQR